MLDRRIHERFELEYAIQLLHDKGTGVSHTLTTNISDGGARLRLPIEDVPDIDTDVRVNLTIERRNPPKLETFTGWANVVRRDEADDDGVTEVALQFTPPLPLQLKEEVPALADTPA